MNHFRFALAGAALAVSQTVTAFTIDINYDFDANNFFNTQARRDVIESAAGYFETIIGDSLDALNPSGTNSWTASFSNPATGASEFLVDFVIPADTVVIFAGGRNLPGSTIGVGGPGGFGASGTDASWIEAVSTRGQVGVNAGPPPTDFGPWGGSVAFDTGTSWYFDSDTSTDEAFTGNDFFSVAMHEIGHVLGLGTSASWDGWISGDDFTGPVSVALFGGNVPLDPGSGGAHWANGTTSTINGVGVFEAANDPSLTTGTRKRFTDLDVAGLADVGWEVTVVPLPPAIWVFGCASVAMVGMTRRR